MSRYRKIKAALLAAVIAASGLAGMYPADALESVTDQQSAMINKWGERTYNANELEVFANRTKEEIGEQYSYAMYNVSSYDNRDKDTWYTTEPSLVDPYDPGAINEDTHQAMVDMMNFYRWIMGCEPLTGNMNHLEDLQYGAMVRNFYFDHNVIDTFKPADMSDEIWQRGADCNHNIIAKGYTPQGAISGWMNEGYDVERESWTESGIGHRAMTMRMTTSEIALGYSGEVAIGRCTNNENPNNMPFTAYPAPGYAPSQLINPSICAWTVEFNDEMFEAECTEDITVTIENKNTKEQWVRTRDKDNLIISFECLVFAQPDDYGDTGYTDSYEVTITGVKDVTNGEAAILTYTVDFFDLHEYSQTRVASAETSMKYMLAPDMMNEKSLKYVASILPNVVTVKTEDNKLVDVPVAGKWTVDTENKCFRNSGDVAKLPARVKDYYGYLENIVVPYEEKIQLLVKYDTLDIVPRVALSGGVVKLTTYRTQTVTDTVHIFKLIDLPDGSCMSIKMFDSTQTEGGCDDVYVGYNINCAAPADSGKYISVYYSQEWLNGRQITPVYVSSNIAELTVNTEYYDLNGDGSVDLADLITMTKVISGHAECPVSADCDKNGRINVFDLILLKNKLGELLA